MTSVVESLGDLAKSALIIFLGSVLGRALALVGEVLIIRSLDPDVFGVLSFAYAIVSSLTVLATLGVNDGMTRLLSEDQSNHSEKQLLQSGILLILISSLTSALLLYLTRNQIAEFVNIRNVSVYLIYLIPFLFAQPISWVLFGVLRARKQSVPAMFSRDIFPRIGSLITLSILLISGQAILGAIVYWISVPLFVLLCSLYFINARTSISSILLRSPDAKSVYELWSFSWPLAVGGAVFLFMGKLDILMIGYFLDQTSVGYYRSIRPFQQMSTFILGSFTFIFLPIATQYFDQGENKELGRFYTVSTKWIIILTTPPVLLFVFFSVDIIHALYGVKYTAAATAMSVLVGGLLIRAITGLNGDMVRAINRPRIELYSAIVGLCANFFINIALIPRLGIIGAALATVFGYAVYNGVETLAIYRETNITPFSWNNLKPIVVSTLFTTVLALTLREQLGILGIFLVGLTIGIVQIISVIVTGSVSETDMILVEKLEGRFGLDLQWIKTFLRS